MNRRTLLKTLAAVACAVVAPLKLLARQKPAPVDCVRLPCVWKPHDFRDINGKLIASSCLQYEYDENRRLIKITQHFDADNLRRAEEWRRQNA